jgi:hypothetical protein
MVPVNGIVITKRDNQNAGIAGILLGLYLRVMAMII